MPLENPSYGLKFRKTFRPADKIIVFEKCAYDEVVKP
jgi:hypothetical protein